MGGKSNPNFRERFGIEPLTFTFALLKQIAYTGTKQPGNCYFKLKLLRNEKINAGNRCHPYHFKR